MLKDYSQILKMWNEILNNSYLKMIKEKHIKWNNIFNISKITTNVEEQKPDEIVKDDMDSIIMPNICKIMNYYDIASETCASDDVKVVDDTAVQVEKWARSGLKILLIVLLSSVWLLVAVIAFFAIKAKMNKQEDYSEDETT